MTILGHKSAAMSMIYSRVMWPWRKVLCTIGQEVARVSGRLPILDAEAHKKAVVIDFVNEILPRHTAVLRRLCRFPAVRPTSMSEFCTLAKCGLDLIQTVE
jgi:hypothetical protein